MIYVNESTKGRSKNPVLINAFPWVMGILRNGIMQLNLAWASAYHCQLTTNVSHCYASSKKYTWQPRTDIEKIWRCVSRITETFNNPQSKDKGTQDKHNEDKWFYTLNWITPYYHSILNAVIADLHSNQVERGTALTDKHHCRLAVGWQQ